VKATALAVVPVPFLTGSTAALTIAIVAVDFRIYGDDMAVKKETKKPVEKKKQVANTEKEEQQKTTVKKKAMLNALKATYGVVSQAAEMVGINRSSHYDWIQDDPAYKKEFESLDSYAVDFVQSKLFEKINMGSTPEIIFFLKTRGRKHGYSEVDAPDTTDKNQFELVNIES